MLLWLLCSLVCWQEIGARHLEEMIRLVCPSEEPEEDYAALAEKALTLLLAEVAKGDGGSQEAAGRKRSISEADFVSCVSTLLPDASVLSIKFGQPAAVHHADHAEFTAARELRVGGKRGAARQGWG